MRPDASPAQALMQHASRRGRVSPSHSQKPGIAASLPRHAVAAVAVEERVSTPQQQTAVTENVVIVGSGPAGYTAAIYAARAHLKPVVFEGFQNGKGGQLMGTTEVENFPGFPEGVTGPELMERMRKQSERWGAELYTEDVEFIDLSRRPFTVRSAEREVRAHSLIIATGATARKLGIPSEQTFWSKGISACAICDAPCLRTSPWPWWGGGDSAAEEAVYLTKYASHVHLLVRGSKLRASKAMADRCLANPLITVHFNTGVEDAEGNGVLAGLQLVDTQTGEKRRLDVAGLFYGIGHTPNTQLLGNQIELDSKGYVKVQHGVATSVEGVFAAGDLHDPEWRQAITAAGSGCMAALSVERYLTQHGLAQEFKPSAEQEEEEEGHGKAAAPAARSMSEDPEALFDVLRDKHRGQFALRKLYHESERLIAVLYTSPSCGPCRSLKPILNAVVDEFPGRLHYVEVDIEADPEIAEAAGINGTPTLQLFKNKDMLQVVPGVKQKREYRELLKTNL
ncbi:hypothetical protein V8C86DRAFT_3015235 [Haematococcus lacustris]